MAQKISRRKFFYTAASIIAIGSIGTGGYLTYDNYNDYKKLNSGYLPKDLKGNPVQYEDPISTQDIEKMDVQENVNIPEKNNISHNDNEEKSSETNSAQNRPLTLKIPQVNMDVKVGELSVVNNVINPPGFKNAYLTRNLGAKISEPDSGTIYITMHSLRNGFGPGNYVIDVKNKRSTLSNNDDIYLGDLHYKVSETKVINKTQLVHEKSVWENIPNTLVIITCLQKESGKSEQNAVIFAQLV